MALLVPVDSLESRSILNLSSERTTPSLARICQMAWMYVLDKVMLSVCLQSDHSYDKLMISPEQSEFSESSLLASS